MSVVIRLKVPIEMHYTVIPMGTSEVNSSRETGYRRATPTCEITGKAAISAYSSLCCIQDDFAYRKQ